MIYIVLANVFFIKQRNSVTIIDNTITEYNLLCDTTFYIIYDDNK